MGGARSKICIGLVRKCSGRIDEPVESNVATSQNLRQTLRIEHSAKKAMSQLPRFQFSNQPFLLVSLAYDEQLHTIPQFVFFQNIEQGFKVVETAQISHIYNRKDWLFSVADVSLSCPI